MGKAEMKLSFVDAKVLYKEKLKGLLKPIRNNKSYSIIAKKINIQKSLAFLYANNEWDREIKKTIPFIIALEQSYLSMNLKEESKKYVQREL